jgi:oligopeptide transport system ATP-binding protein
MSLICEPDLLIADEPTTSLDVTVQAQVLNLLKNIRSKRKISIILITHNLGVAANICDRIIVMYAGKILEEATVDEIFHNPLHPYTSGLLNSLPYFSIKRRSNRLVCIKGNPVDMLNLPEGCSFAPRCEFCMNICLRRKPPCKSINEKHKLACWLYYCK